MRRDVALLVVALWRPTEAIPRVHATLAGHKGRVNTVRWLRPGGGELVSGGTGVRHVIPVVWCGVVWCGMVWYGVVWCGVVWCGVVWCGVVWCGVVWCGVVWCGVVWCGVVWCGVVWCGVVCRRCCYQKAKGRDVYPRVQVNGRGCVCGVRAVCKCGVA